MWKITKKYKCIIISIFLIPIMYYFINYKSDNI